MSTFLGHIAELPNICVDNFFSLTCSSYFLSHCHSDHIQGLKDNGFLVLLKTNPDVNLYCSSITKLIISKFQELHNVMHKVVELSFLTRVDVPSTELYSTPYHVTVSLIPTGHCPGSVMFLYETATKCILYTGDFRIAEGDTRKFKQLHNGESVKTIDCIYLDCTFLSENFWVFPPRDKSIATIVDEIEEWLSRGLKYSVKIMMSSYYGQEAVIISVAEASRCKIHVQKNFFSVYSRVPEIISFLTEDCSSTRIHADYKGSQKPCITSISEFVLRIYPTAQFFPCRKNCEPKVKVWCKPNHLKINYSSHSSGSAIEDFLLTLRPKKIFPCSSTVRSTNEERDIMIHNIMSQWENRGESKYDEVIRKKSVKELVEMHAHRPRLPRLHVETLSSSLDSSGKTVMANVAEIHCDEIDPNTIQSEFVHENNASSSSHLLVGTYQPCAENEATTLSTKEPSQGNCAFQPSWENISNLEHNEIAKLTEITVSHGNRIPQLNENNIARSEIGPDTIEDAWRLSSLGKSPDYEMGPITFEDAWAQSSLVISSEEATKKNLMKIVEK